MKYEPNKENLVNEDNQKKVFYHCDENGKPIYKSKEIYKTDKLIIFYPFSIFGKLKQLSPKKIKVVEFRGWDNIDKLPKDFSIKPGYGFSSNRAKQFFSTLTRKLPTIDKIVIGVNTPTRILAKTISLNLNDFEQILRAINKEKIIYDKNRKIAANNSLAGLTKKVKKVERILTAGELEFYLAKFDSFENISAKDVESLTRILSDLPVSKITATNHIISAKEKIDIIYLEDIISDFNALLKNASDNEEEWQKFFQKNTWTLTHLFPYEVILSKGKAYVGGKTFENEEGRIVDFLFETGFKDNFALLEIKTPKKQLLKNNTYRAPSVFSVSDELSGGVNQCLDQKDNFLRELGQKYKSLDPKSILVIGQKTLLTAEQKTCFELYRANQKNIDIVTFDELLSKLTGLYNVITGKKRVKK